MATVQRLNDSGSWVDVTDYAEWVVEHGTSPVVVVPSATLRAVDPDVSIDANDRIRIQDSGGTTFFAGKATTAGKYDQFGKRDIPVDGIGTELFSERVSYTSSGDPGPPASSVLLGARVNTETGGDWTINYQATDPTLDNDYVADNRQVKAIFRDIMDRVGAVWWVDTVNLTIHVNTPGGRGSFAAVETGTDDVAVKEWDEGDVETVRNDVTVYGTGDVQVQGSAEFASSISDYGRRSEEYNFDYITDASEANSMANDLLQPFPLESGTLLAGDSVGNITQNLSNYTVDVTDSSRGINATGIAVEKATLREGRAELELGEGAGVSLENLNRKSKSRDDTTEPGSVMDTDRIADLAVTAAKIVDGIIDSAKLAAGAVLNENVADHEVTGGGLEGSKMADGFLDDLGRMVGDVWPGGDTAIGITDDPLDIDDYACDFEEQAGSTQVRLAYDTGDDLFYFYPFGTSEMNVGVAGNRMQNVYTDVVHSGSVIPATGDGTGDLGNSANEWGDARIETIAPTQDDTGQVGFPGGEGAYTEMNAYAFYDADTGDELTADGGDPLQGLSDGRGPPEWAARTDDDGNVQAYKLNDVAKGAWDVCRAQQARIEELENRLERLERGND